MLYKLDPSVKLTGKRNPVIQFDSRANCSQLFGAIYPALKSQVGAQRDEMNGGCVPLSDLSASRSAHLVVPYQ